MICGISDERFTPTPVDDPGWPCCDAACYRDDCTCWTPVYDLEQSHQALGDISEIHVRAAMCEDCAYRPDSPERTDDDFDDPLGLGRRTPFSCHQGIRRVVAYVHPDGRRIEAGPGDYDPPIVTLDKVNVPLRADGTPADRCAGWAAHNHVPSGPAPLVLA